MKHFIKKILSIALITIVLICSAATCFADGEAEINYQQLFSEAMTTDGAYAEAYVDNVCTAFDANPNEFLNALASQPQETVDALAGMLVYGHYFENFTTFKETINCYSTLTDLDEEHATVVESIQECIEKLETSTVKDTPEKNIKVDGFNRNIICEEIALNKEIGNIDEQFFHTLTEAYIADPALFAEILAEMSNKDVEYLINGIAYDCKKNDINLPADVSNYGEDCVNLSRILLTAINNPDNQSIYSFYDDSDFEESIVSGPTAELQSLQVPTIGSMIYTSGDLTVGTTETLQITFSEDTTTLSSRQYWVEIYARFTSGNVYYKTGKYVTIAPGNTSQIATFNMSFSGTGTFYTICEVYSTKGGSLLTSRQGAYPDDVNGYWHIDVNLPTDRDYLGELSLYNAGGVLLLNDDCLGRSAYNYDMYTTYGHTPTGEYTGYLYGPVSDTDAYGPYKVINMTGQSGVIVSSGRSGIWIHGGRTGYSSPSDPWYPLYPTLGCVRVSNSFQNNLQNTITSLINSGYYYTTGTISICEVIII